MKPTSRLPRLLGGLLLGATLAAAPACKKAPPPEKHRDPVCHMVVDPIEADTPRAEFNGKTYYFCNQTDQVGFKKDPAKFFKPDWKPRMLKADEVK
jgi:YHS domain-containing protein